MKPVHGLLLTKNYARIHIPFSIEMSSSKNLTTVYGVKGVRIDALYEYDIPVY